MTGAQWLDHVVVAEYSHFAFLFGVLIGYLYFRRRQISVGGTLAVGYLAASLYSPLNAVVTVLVSLLGYLFIRFVILRLFLPRPRQIFGIGLLVGIGCGLIWLAVTEAIGQSQPGSLALVGVVVPGMLCNSFVKQGPGRTLLPLAWMVPVSGLLGFGLAMLSGDLLPLDGLRDDEAPSVMAIFAISAVSVGIALLVQERTARSTTLRTGGYVTAGLVVLAAATAGIYLMVLAIATAVVLAIYVPFARRVPLFGKDRFIVLLLLSFTMVTVQEILLTQFTDMRVGGAQSVVFAILPAIVANDLVQYGVKRTADGMGLAVAGCAAVAVPLLTFA